MNLIEQLQTDVARHQRQLEERLAELKAETLETRKVLASVTRYHEKLLKQHPNGEAVLPLADPDEDDEWEANKADELTEMLADTSDDAPPPSDDELTIEEYQAQRSTPEPAPSPIEEPLVPGFGLGASRPVRRRKATAEE